LAGGQVQSLAAQPNNPQNVKSPVAAAPIPNPLREGMIALDTAFRDLVSAVALDESEKVRNAAIAMHDAREKGMAGLLAGLVILPKNAQRDKAFFDQDQKFHDKLEALDRAARHNNQREMQRITQMLLAGCVKCHQTFRK
jgi:hypothetical protein